MKIICLKCIYALGSLILISSAIAQQVQTVTFPKATGIEWQSGSGANLLAVKNSANECSVIILPQGVEFELPRNVWVREARSESGNVVMLLQRSSDRSPGYWSFGCLVAELIEAGSYRLKLGLTQQMLEADGVVRSLMKIEKVSSFPVVQFEVGTSAPQGGRVTYKSEWWN